MLNTIPDMTRRIQHMRIYDLEENVKPFRLLWKENSGVCFNSLVRNWFELLFPFQPRTKNF